MELGRPFNTFTLQEYQEIIPLHKKYKDFNRLGLYRSIMENDKLDLEEKEQVIDLANSYFQKTYDFLVLKDPGTWFELEHIGKELSLAQQRDLWDKIKEKQEKIIKEKRFGHRNFGVYSKHICGDDSCPYNGLMIHPNSKFAESEIHFKSDKNKTGKKHKSMQHKSERKASKHMIDRDLDLDI